MNYRAVFASLLVMLCLQMKAQQDDQLPCVLISQEVASMTVAEASVGNATFDSVLAFFPQWLGFAIKQKDMPQTYRLLQTACCWADSTSCPRAARGWAIALVLSQLVPDRAKGLFNCGYQSGKNSKVASADMTRLQAGMVVAQLNANPVFSQLMATARQEISPLRGETGKRMKINRIHPLSIEKRQAMQGMAIYGDYMVSLQNTGLARIYSLPAMTPLTHTFNLGSAGPYNHANAAAFGTERVETNDTLPVLYVSQCSAHGQEHDVCYVERISPSGSATLVQTIELADHNRYYGGALCWTVDRQKGELVAYGNTINNIDVNNRFRVACFRLPKLAAGRKVTLRMEEALSNDVIQDTDSRYPSQSVMQGACAYKGKLYIPTGFGEEQYPSMLYVWDINKRRLAAAVDMQACVTDEFEDVDFYQGRPVIQCNSRAVTVFLDRY